MSSSSSPHQSALSWRPGHPSCEAHLTGHLLSVTLVLGSTSCPRALSLGVCAPCSEALHCVCFLIVPHSSCSLGQPHAMDFIYIYIKYPNILFLCRT